MFIIGPASGRVHDFVTRHFGAAISPTGLFAEALSGAFFGAEAIFAETETTGATSGLRECKLWLIARGLSVIGLDFGLL